MRIEPQRLGHRNDFAVNTGPALSTILLRLFLGSIALGAFRDLRCGDLHDFSVKADPATRWRRSLTSAGRFLGGRVAVTAPPLAVLRGSLDDAALSGGPADAAPARFAILLGFFRRRIALQIFLPGLRFVHRHNFPIQADPALSAISLRFFRTVIARQAFLLGLYLAHRHNFSIHADPAIWWWSLATGARFLFGREALTALLLAVVRGGLDDSSGASGDEEAAPAGLAILLRVLLGGITLDASLLSIRFGDLHDSSVQTDPALPAILLRFIRGCIARSALLLGLCRSHLHDFPANADPALLTILLRFFLGSVALALRLALRPSGLDNLAVNAGPPTRLAIPDRFFLGTETWRPRFLRVCSDRLNDLPIGTSPTRFAAALRVARIVKTGEAFCLAISPGRLDNFLIQAIPVRTATLDRFFRRTVTLTAIRLTFGRPAQVDVTFDTGVAPILQV